MLPCLNPHKEKYIICLMTLAIWSICSIARTFTSKQFLLMSFFYLNKIFLLLFYLIFVLAILDIEVLST
jgi:hypothetical protein